MRLRYQITDQTPVYFITASTHCWVPLLFNDTIFQIILDRLKYCQGNKGLNLHGYVFMPNHLHAIFSHQLPDQLPGIIRDFKRYTSTKISTYLASLGQFSQLFWLKRFHSQERGQTRL